MKHGPRPCPVRDGLRPSRKTPKHELAARYTADLIASGNCVSCYRKRGKNGTERYCRTCADRHAARQRLRVAIATEGKMAGTNTRRKRIRLGLCQACAKPRGNDGSNTMCRECLLKRMVANGMPLKHVRSADGFIKLKCENCFEEFNWSGSGQRTMCDACMPWFQKVWDEKAEQAQARKINGFQGHMAARAIVREWLKQG